MDVGAVIGVGGGLCGIGTVLYVVGRVGWRTDELWKGREDVSTLRVQLATLTERVSSLQTYALHRAEAEARVHHAIRDK